MKILFYRSDWASNATRQSEDEYGAVGYYRIVKPASMMKGHEVTVVGAQFTKKGESLEERYTRIFTEYDVLWACYTAHAEDASAMFYFRDKFKKKVILDVDDNYLDVLDSHPLYDKLKQTKKDRAFISTALTFADAITVSTEPLKQRLHEHFKNVYKMEKNIIVLPNMMDVDVWKVKPAKKRNNRIVIGYAGSNSHQNDLKMLAPHLAYIMKKYPNVYFETMGAIGKDELSLFDGFTKDAMNRCDLLPATQTYKQYPKHLASMKWDIALAPLEDNAFTRCKSHIKWMEYSMCELPVIASRVHPYYVDLWGRKVIEHDKTGLLVKPREWSDAMEDLILNANKRELLATQAKEAVIKNWQYGGDFTLALENILKSL